MRRRRSIQAGLTATAAALALAALVASASANRLSVTSQHLRAIWREIVWEPTSRTSRVECPVTLEGTFHSATIVKTIGALVGFITRASVKGENPPCTGGTVTLLSASLPWHITYEGYTGVLPRLGGVVFLIIGGAFQVHPTGSITCLARSEARHPAQATANLEASGLVEKLTPAAGKTFPLTGEGGMCALAGEGTFREEGTGNVTNDTGGMVTVTLI